MRHTLPRHRITVKCRFWSERPAANRSRGWSDWPSVKCARVERLRVAAVLAPDADLLLHRPVGEAEEHAFAVQRLVHDGPPAGNDEDVLGSPLQGFLAHTRLAPTFHGDKHGGVGGAIATGLEGLGE